MDKIDRTICAGCRCKFTKEDRWKIFADDDGDDDLFHPLCWLLYYDEMLQETSERFKDMLQVVAAGVLGVRKAYDAECYPVLYAEIDEGMDDLQSEVNILKGEMDAEKT